MSRTVAVLGLGEAGSRYAADLLAAGLSVRGFDPDSDRAVPTLVRAASPAEAVRDAEVVLSLNNAAVAVAVARQAAPGLSDGAVYADLNTASPSVKRNISDVVSAVSARFVDVAVLASVPRAGLRTPLLVAGAGRHELSEFLGRLGVPVDEVGPEPGAAAGAKLLRSVFMKGLAAVIGEALEAAEAAGQREWMWDQIVGELQNADAALVERLVEGTQLHAARRADELTAVVTHLGELGVSSLLSEATKARLTDLAARDSASS